jgi:hypothetical protein
MRFLGYLRVGQGKIGRLYLPYPIATVIDPPQSWLGQDIAESVQWALSTVKYLGSSLEHCHKMESQ